MLWLLFNSPAHMPFTLLFFLNVRFSKSEFHAKVAVEQWCNFSVALMPAFLPLRWNSPSCRTHLSPACSCWATMATFLQLACYRIHGSVVDGSSAVWAALCRTLKLFELGSHTL